MKIIAQLFISLILIILFYLTGNYLYNHFHSNALVIPVESAIIKNCHILPSCPQNGTFKILVIDGGGIAGILPLMVLNYLEQQSRKPISDLFDLFVGTSTGSIIISALNIPNKHGKPKYSANQIIALYISFSKTAMFTSISRKILTIDGILGPKFSGRLLYGAFIKEIGGNIPFKTLIKKVVITAYNLSESKLTLFKSWDCSEINFPLPALLSAATATPFLYPAVIFKDAKNGTSNTYVDGMLSVNHPIFYALQQAFDLCPNAKKYIIVHLGTGVFPVPDLRSSNTSKWGILEWGLPMVSIVYGSRAEDIDRAMAIIKKIIDNEKIESFHFSLNVDSRAFDISTENINAIKAHADLIISQRMRELNYLAQLLSKN